VQRPSLEYQYAFDLCAVALQPVAGPIAVLASHPFCGRELAARVDPAAVTLFAAPAWDLSTAEVHAWLGAENAGTETDLESLGASSVAAVVWAEPECEGGPEVLARIGQVTKPTGRLYVVTSSPLRRYLPEWQVEAWRPAQHPAGYGATIRWLRMAGWQAQERYGFHGPRSVLWGLAARLAAAGERQDWADRCLAAMRARYLVRGWQSLLAPVSVIMARKG
jgi:hypothetical protein